MEEYFSSSLNKNDHITEHHVNNVVEVMASKSTKASAKPAGKVKESKGTHKSTGPSLKDVDKLLKENEDLRTQLRVASGQVAYLRENLDPSAFRKAAGITAPDGNHLYDEALRSAEKIINKQKCELEELQRNKQGSAFRKAAGITSQDENHLYEDAMRSAEEIINKLTRELVELKRNKQSQPNEMDGKTRNEKDVSKDGENATLKAEIEHLKEQIKELTTQLSDAETNNRPVKGTAPDVPYSSDEIKRLKDENEKITKQAKADVSKLESELQNVKSDLEQTKQKLNISLEEEKRLNTVVGAQIAADNPHIAELSDESRPTKLAETYSEIYDNEWTDAYEDMENEGLNEGKAIQKLLGILMDVDGDCRSMANDFKNNIKRAALSLSENGSNVKETKIDVTRNNLLKEIQKSFAPLLVEDVYKNLVKKIKLKLPKNTERFYRSCVELCWLMSVQDPPVVFDTPKTGGKFDSDRYRTYTKMGKQLDYVVWPPMLLHAGGPLLAKGVAQGK
ncbi:uncharacterized protein MCAP_0864-like [Mya arenaria]|uniref:uncharacterized protein MCAP_0864-like n=1 Tax=Mya arenaria TaxID=6604 RepID=UPI0022E77C78|nr:uncharacterized protein MCAP_0864-like [Mya arenaria]